MYRRIVFLLTIVTLTLAAALTMAHAQAGPPPPSPGPDPHAPGKEPPAPDAAPTAQVLSADEGHVTQNGETYTWTQDTRADWETGTWENLDGATVSGTLQLMQRWFGESTTVTPRDQLAAEQWEPALAVGPDGTLYAVWTDERNGDGDIYFARSTDGGATWSANVQVNDDAAEARQGNPALAVGPDGTLYAVWEDPRNGDSDIYFARSTDDGATWSANVRVNDDAGTASTAYWWSPPSPWWWEQTATSMLCGWTSATAMRTSTLLILPIRGRPGAQTCG